MNRRDSASPVPPAKASHDPQPKGHGHNLKERAIDEVKHFAILFVYLWILFGLFVLNERIVLQQHRIDFAAQGFAVINALVLAKVMLIAQDLNLGRRWSVGR